MDKSRDKNLLFAVLAVQLKGVSPDKVMEAASAWIVNPDLPLSKRLEDANLLKPADVQLLDSLVEQMVQACKGDTYEAIRSIHGAQYFTKSIIERVPSKPSDATRAMDAESPWEAQAPHTSTMEEYPGRYSQISEYGKGGMGRVLLVHDAFLGRDIALKELLLPHDSGFSSAKPSPMRESSMMLARFLQEARITGQLEHPSIVPVYEVGRRVDGTLYYTMKLVRGDTLGKALHGCKSLEERMKYLSNLVDMCQALTYAHHRGVIHRDIKPSNVMIGEFGETVLLDWGLAKLRGEKDVYAEKLSRTMQLFKMDQPQSTPMTAAGEALGTPHYMSPEQAKGLIEQLDERSDVYGMGAVLYELLTGNPPYNGPTAEGIIRQVIAEAPKPVREYEADAPPELVSICERAMARRHEDRYQTMKALRDELSRFQTGAFVHSYKYTPREVLRRYYRRHRTLVNAAAAAALLLLATGIYSFLQIRNARDHEHAQRLAAESAQKAEAVARDESEQQQYLAQIHLAQDDMEEHQFALANDVLWKAPASKRDWAWGYLLNQANPDLFTVHSDKSVIFWANFNPAGDRIVTLRDPEPPGLWDGHTGVPIMDFEGETAAYNNAFFNADGSLFAAIGDDELDVWNTVTGKRLQHITRASSGYDLAFVPGEQHVWASYDDGQLIEWDLDKGTQVRAFDTKAGANGHIELLPKGDLLLAASNAGAIQAWDTASGSKRYAIEGENMECSPDGALCAVTNGSTIRIHDTAKGELKSTLNGHKGTIHRMSFSKDGSRLLSASFDHTVRMWNTSTGELIRTLDARFPVLFAYFLDAEQNVLGCTGENGYFLWDATTGTILQHFAGEGKALAAAYPASDGAHVVAASAFHTFQVFDPLRAPGLKAICATQTPSGVSAGALSGFVMGVQSKRCAAWWGGGDTLVYDIDHLRPLAYYARFNPGATCAAWSPDGSRIIYLTDGMNPLVFDAAKHEILAVHGGHTNVVRALACHPDGHRAASGDASGQVQLWDMASGQTEKSLNAGVAVLALAFTPDGSQIVAGCRNGKVQVFNIQTGNVERNIAAHSSAVISLAMRYDGKSIATASRDGAFAVWDLATGKPLAAFPSEEAYINEAMSQIAVDFSFDGHFLIGRSAFQRSHMWDLNKGQPRLDFPAGDQIAPLPDGRSALLAQSAGILRVVDAAEWKAMPPGEAAREAFNASRITGQAVAPVQSKEDAPRVIVCNATQLNRFLGALVSHTEAAAPSTGQGWPIDKDLADTGNAFNLCAGNTLDMIDGKPLRTLGDVEAAVKTLRAHHADKNFFNSRWQITQTGRKHQVVINVLPVVSASKSLDASQADLRGFLDALSSNLRLSAFNVNWLPDGSLPAMVASGQGGHEDRLARLGLLQCDGLLTLNDVAFTDRAGIERALQSAIKVVTDNPSMGFKLSVNRGLPAAYNLQYKIDPSNTK